MKRFIRHIKRWNIWRKRNINGRFHKFLTLLFGRRYSPTFRYVFIEEEIAELRNDLDKLLATHGYTIDI